MRVLLDTKDLINVLEHDRPVKLSELRDYLLAQNSTIVLTFGNVRELAAPLAQGAPNVHVNFLLQRVETLPVSYLGEVMLPGNEVQAAVRAFNSGAEYQPIDPYVSRWDETMSGTPSATARGLILGLNEIVLLAAREDRSLFAGFGFYEGSLRKLFENDRLLPAPARVPEKNFPNVLGRAIAANGIEKPVRGIEEFGQWVYADPRRCPALRLGHDAYHEILKNVADVPEAGDIPDLMQIKCTPYVDIVTLDRRMRGYCSQVCQRLQKAHPFINYSDRIFSSLEELMSAKP